MLGPKRPLVTILTAAVLVSPTPQALAGALAVRANTDIYGLYQRLRPGMSVEEVAATVNGARLRTPSHAVTSWLIWSQPEAGRATAVLRATFREGRLARLEYEVFGDQYQRLVKGSDSGVEISRAELHRLWRDKWEVERATDACQAALEAYHHLVLGAQERLTQEEQAAWVRALELRRAVEGQLGRPASR